MEALSLLASNTYKQRYTNEQVKFLVESDPQAALNLLNKCWPPRACATTQEMKSDIKFRNWNDLTWMTHTDNSEFELSLPEATGHFAADIRKQESSLLKYNENFVFRAMDEQYQRLNHLAKENTPGEWARLGDLDTARGCITLLHPSRLTPLRILMIALLAEGSTLPPMYKGQLVRVTDIQPDRWSIASGLPYIPSRPKHFAFEGAARIAVVCIPASTNDQAVARVCSLMKNARVNGCVVLMTDTCGLNDVEKIISRETDCLVVTDGGLGSSPISVHEYMARVSLGGGKLPCVFSAVDLKGITNDRHAEADKLLAEIINQRHLLPAAWLTDFPPSLQPEYLADAQITPGEDVVLVTPTSTSSGVKELIGQYLGHTLVRLPPMHMAIIAMKGDCRNEGRVPLLQHRVSVAVTQLTS